MAYHDVNDENAVLAAVKEYDELGRDGFLKKYGFGKAKSYFLVIDGKRYDSKAIFGVAHGFQHPARGPLRSDQFVGGASTVAKALGDMDFVVDGPERTIEAQLETCRERAEKDGAFSPDDIEDARQRTLTAIVQRQGQRKFRSELLRAYGGRCAVTSCDALEVLEAAHIIPYQGPKTNHVSNGLLLRADVHTLFDLKLLSIDPHSGTIQVAQALRATEYRAYHGEPIRLPIDAADRPNADALMAHFVEAHLDK